MSRYRQQTGVSLVEILVTIVILSSLFTGILTFYTSSLRSTSSSYSRSKAKFLAEQEMERLISLDYLDDELNAFNNFEGRTQFFENNEYILKTLVIFIDPTTGGTKEPYPVSFDEDTHLKKLIVSATRKDGIGGQVDLTTFISP